MKPRAFADLSQLSLPAVARILCASRKRSTLVVELHRSDVGVWFCEDASAFLERDEPNYRVDLLTALCAQLRFLLENVDEQITAEAAAARARRD